MSGKNDRANMTVRTGIALVRICVKLLIDSKSLMLC